MTWCGYINLEFVQLNPDFIKNLICLHTVWWCTSNPLLRKCHEQLNKTLLKHLGKAANPALAIITVRRGTSPSLQITEFSAPAGILYPSFVRCIPNSKIPNSTFVFSNKPFNFKFNGKVRYLKWKCYLFSRCLLQFHMEELHVSFILPIFSR